MGDVSFRIEDHISAVAVDRIRDYIHVAGYKNEADGYAALVRATAQSIDKAFENDDKEYVQPASILRAFFDEAIDENVTTRAEADSLYGIVNAGITYDVTENCHAKPVTPFIIGLTDIAAEATKDRDDITIMQSNSDISNLGGGNRAYEELVNRAANTIKTYLDGKTYEDFHHKNTSPVDQALIELISDVYCAVHKVDDVPPSFKASLDDIHSIEDILTLEELPEQYRDVLYMLAKDGRAGMESERLQKLAYSYTDRLLYGMVDMQDDAVENADFKAFPINVRMGGDEFIGLHIAKLDDVALDDFTVKINDAASEYANHQHGHGATAHTKTGRGNGVNNAITFDVFDGKEGKAEESLDGMEDGIRAMRERSAKALAKEIEGGESFNVTVPQKPKFTFRQPPNPYADSSLTIRASESPIQLYMRQALEKVGLADLAEQSDLFTYDYKTRQTGLRDDITLSDDQREMAERAIKAESLRGMIGPVTKLISRQARDTYIDTIEHALPDKISVASMDIELSNLGGVNKLGARAGNAVLEVFSSGLEKAFASTIGKEMSWEGKPPIIQISGGRFEVLMADNVSATVRRAFLGEVQELEHKLNRTTLNDLHDVYHLGLDEATIAEHSFEPENGGPRRIRDLKNPKEPGKKGIGTNAVELRQDISSPLSSNKPEIRPEIGGKPHDSVVHIPEDNIVPREETVRTTRPNIGEKPDDCIHDIKLVSTVKEPQNKGNSPKDF